MDIQVGELSGLVGTEGTTVADPLVGRPHMALQTVSSEALVVALVGLLSVDVHVLAELVLFRERLAAPRLGAL